MTESNSEYGAATHPLAPVAKMMIEAIRDRNLEFWRDFLRGRFYTRAIGGEIPETFEDDFVKCRFTEQQMAWIWMFAFQVADYQMYTLMDFLEVEVTCDALEITFTLPSGEKVPVGAGEMLPAMHLEWSRRFGTVSGNWATEKLRDRE